MWEWSFLHYPNICMSVKHSDRIKSARQRKNKS